MQHRTIKTTDRNGYILELNRLTSEGYRVISAGASFNAGRDLLEWWAVLGRQEETQQTTGATNLLEAAKMIADFCDRIGGACAAHNDGAGCPLFDQRFIRCKAACRSRNDTAPRYWAIRKEDDNV